MPAENPDLPKQKYPSFWQAEQLPKHVKLQATFVEDTSGIILTGKLVTITSTHYGTSKGYTDSTGTVIGLIPADETLILTVVDGCNNIIYTRSIGPYSTTINLGNLYTNHFSSPVSYTLNGTAVTCANTPVAKGSMTVTIGTDHYTSTITNGSFTLTFTICSESLPPVTWIAYDSVNNQPGPSQTLDIHAGIQNIGEVKACPLAPVALFTYNATPGYAPDTITFSNTSTNATSYAWDFGDNSTSTHQNPVHVYLTPGDYKVTLTATGPGGANSTTDSVQISLLLPIPACTYIIKYNATGAPVSDTVYFSNTSSHAISYLWDFGDGTTSTVQDPVHIYNVIGNYTVTLTATGINGSKSTSKIIPITGTPPVGGCNCKRPVPPGCAVYCGF